MKDKVDCSWFSQPVIKDVKSKKHSKLAIHPTFETLVKYLKDPYWIQLFKKIAKGKLPKGFFILNDVLWYRKNDKEDSIVLTDDEEDIDDIVNFFRSNGSLYSPLDQEINMRQNLSYVDEINWTSCSKELKSVLLCAFADNISSKYMLNTEKKRQLTQLLLECFRHGAISKNNIIISGSRIKSIDGLYRDNEIFKFDYDKYPLKLKEGLKHNKSNKKTKGPFLAAWNHLNKHIKTKISEISDISESVYDSDESSTN